MIVFIDKDVYWLIEIIDYRVYVLDLDFCIDKNLY